MTNSLGIKGAGEGGINACGAAIGAAIDDAIGQPGLVTGLPLTPERLRDLIRQSDRWKQPAGVRGDPTESLPVGQFKIRIESRE